MATILNSAGASSRREARAAAAAFGAALLCAVPAAAQPVPSAPSPASPPPKWGAHLDLEGKIGNQRQLGEADLFVPLWQNSDTLVFGNVRTRLDDDDSREGNLGAGVRHMLPSGWNVGGYGYFDRRKTEHGNYFNQVTLGAEALSADWDFRVNVYRPEGRRSKNVDSLNTAEISGASVIFRGGEERSLTGFDGEIGWRVPVFDLDAGRALRVYAGAYRFYADGVDPVQGPRGRAELTFDEVPGLWGGSRLTLGAEAQHDGPRGGQVFAVARLRIPLQVFGETRANLTPLERRMTDPTVRDVDVVSQAGALGAPETATTANGGTLTVLGGDTSGNGSLTDELTTAGANSTVILSGTVNTTSDTTIQSGQTLMGAGTLTVRSASGRTTTLTTTGAATINQTNAQITAQSGSTISGLTISRTQTAAGTVAAVSLNANSTLKNSTVTATTTIGAEVRAAIVFGGNVVISGNVLTATGGGGSAAAVGIASNGNAGLVVSNNTLSATGATSNAHTRLTNTTVVSGSSTGNVINNGVCVDNGGNTGSISYTNGTTCP